MDKNEILNSEFLKQFKNSEEFEGFMKNLYKRGIEQILEGEIDGHLGYSKHSKSSTNNSRNGYSTKKLQSEYGSIDLNVPRDRDGSFSPEIVPKRKTRVEGIEQLVVSLYAKGMSVSDIEQQLLDFYDLKVSTTTISKITNRVSQDIEAWQNRPLESVYLIVWMDGIVFKVRDNGKVINKTIYLAIGLNTQGYKEVLGMWLAKNESSSYWMSVMTDLQARGVEDILLTCTDNLQGFTTAITAIFPNAQTQICVVHQIRNACRYVVWKDRKEFTADMKNIYNAPNQKVAATELGLFANKWENKYAYAVKSWRDNWENLTVFFEFPAEIRRIIYTTNLIENLNGKLRKYTKNKLSFPNDQAVNKAVYLALREITKKWTQPIRNWALIMNQFIAIYQDRIKL
jgi:transposase-like protein